ncbi:hypothetical protein BGZ91_002249 [Linnemannia elongata]|nr:hypothetical protein BGZ91_002249 [Linnemannia elongata]
MILVASHQAATKATVTARVATGTGITPTSRSGDPPTASSVNTSLSISVDVFSVLNIHNDLQPVLDLHLVYSLLFHADYYFHGGATPAVASCKTTLSEQAMLGHLAGDPDKKLFSTNLAVGGSVCGYKLVQACAGCKTDRGNGHFWIFYANQVVSHWRRIKDGNYAVTTAATISTASTSDTTTTTTTTTEKETTPAAAVSKGSLEDLCPQLSAVSMSQFEQSENVTHAMDKQGGGAFGEVDVVLAKCHLASVECEGDDDAEGRPMYWDDLPTWQSQAEGNVGR